MMLRGALVLLLAALDVQGAFLPPRPRVLLNTGESAVSRDLLKRTKAEAHGRLQAATGLEEAAEEGIRFFDEDLQETEDLLKPVEQAMKKEKEAAAADAKKSTGKATVKTEKEAAAKQQPTTEKSSKKLEVAAGKTAAPAPPKPAMMTEKIKNSMSSLQHLFDHMKSNIGFYNKKEKEMKGKCTDKLEREEKKLEQLEKEGNRTDLSAFDRELNRNQTELSQKMVTYWKGVRENQHSQYRNSLAMAHTLMSRIKLASNVYADKLAGKKVDPKTMKALSQFMPSAKAALVQRHTELQAFHKEMHRLMHDGVRAALRSRLLRDRGSLSLFQRQQ